MTRPLRFALIIALAGGLAAPALADPGRDHHHRHDDHRHKHKPKHRHKHHEEQSWRYCPPGLVQRGRECLSPGHVRRDRRAYPGVGDILRPADYRRIGDPGRYDLPPGGDWNYYRDDNRIYQVDKSTQKIMAVLSLIQAFSN